MRIPTLSGSLLLLAFAPALHAQYFEARNSAMGGAGIASSHYLIAGTANPALLTRHGETDDFGLRLPTVGAQVYDESNLLDDIQDFADEYDRLASAGGTSQEYADLAQQLADLSGRSVYGNAGVGFAFAMPSKSFAWSLHWNTFADLVAFTLIDPADVTAIATTPAGTPLPDLNSEGRIVGVSLSELGFSMATRFEVGESTGLSVGVTPKYQRVDTYNYSANIDTFDESDFTDSQYRTDDASFNVDLGVALEPGSGFTFGVMARNLIEEEYDTVTTFGQTFQYTVEPTVGVGASWTHGILTLASDVDLMPRDRFQIDAVDDDVQFLSLGAEVDLWKWFQLRGGYQSDLQDFVDDAVTGGIGLSPFDVFRIDVAGIYVNDDSYGAVAQLSFTF